MKKIISILLALTLALSLCTTAWADTTVTTLEDLNAELASGATTITLGDNITGTVTISAGKTVTLNLGGKTLTGGIVNKGTLTVTGTGSVNATAADTAAVANFPDGTVTLSGGTYTSARWYVIKNLGTMFINGEVSVGKPANCEDTSSLIANGWYGGVDTVAGESVPAAAGKAKLTITSGNFEGKSGTKSCSVIKNDDYGVLEISGGMFDSTNNTGSSNAATLLNWNVATISGGTFKGSYPISNGAYEGDADKGMLTITNGEFIGSEKIFGMGQGGNGKGSVAISGGRFEAPTMGDSFAETTGGYAVSVTGGTFSNAENVADFVPNTAVAAVIETQVDANTRVKTSYVGADNVIQAAKTAKAGDSLTVYNGTGLKLTGVQTNVVVYLRSTQQLEINGVVVAADAANGGYTVPAPTPAPDPVNPTPTPDPTPDRPNRADRPVRRYSTNTTTTTEPAKEDSINSAKTFDAGVALYVGMALTSVTGMAWVGKKRGR